MAVVAFDYELWAARFPELAQFVGPDLALLYWNEAGSLYVDNTPSSVIIDDSAGGQRAMILNLAVAHLAMLNAVLNGQAPSSLVGRIMSATQGSVTVQTAPLTPNSPSQDWWSQTRYGMQVWQALAPFRTALYMPGPYNRFQRSRSPFARGFGWRV